MCISPLSLSVWDVIHNTVSYIQFTLQLRYNQQFLRYRQTSTTSCLFFKRLQHECVCAECRDFYMYVCVLADQKLCQSGIIVIVLVVNIVCVIGYGLCRVRGSSSSTAAVESNSIPQQSVRLRLSRCTHVSYGFLWINTEKKDPILLYYGQNICFSVYWGPSSIDQFFNHSLSRSLAVFDVVWV